MAMKSFESVVCSFCSNTQKYRLAERAGTLNNLSMVKVIFSRHRGESKHIALVTDDLNASMRTIVADYLIRWSIEMLIKDEKQHLGLGDYRVLRFQAVVRHLHLVDCLCLTDPRGHKSLSCTRPKRDQEGAAT